MRPIVGDALTERIGPVWGFDEEGELAGMWRPTGQPGAWFLAGGLAQCRIFSKVLALQIKARELGIVPNEVSLGRCRLMAALFELRGERTRRAHVGP